MYVCYKVKIIIVKLEPSFLVICLLYIPTLSEGLCRSLSCGLDLAFKLPFYTIASFLELRKIM